MGHAESLRSVFEVNLISQILAVGVDRIDDDVDGMVFGDNGVAYYVDGRRELCTGSTETK